MGGGHPPDRGPGGRARRASRGGTPRAHPHLAVLRCGRLGRAGRGVVRQTGPRGLGAYEDRARRGGREDHEGCAMSETAVRIDGRAPGDLRPLKVQMGYLEWAEGSALLEMGKTVVLVSASFEPRVPKFLQGTGSGWVTAEYAMLPRSTAIRTPREVQAGRPSGRTQEIQRLVGPSLRGITALERLGECTIWIDCDVLQADGGTRTASITAGYLALAQALRVLAQK